MQTMQTEFGNQLKGIMDANAKALEDMNTQYQQQLQAQQEAQVRQPMPQQQVRRPDPKAEKWAQRNDWFGEDEAMTYAAFGIHKKLVETINKTKHVKKTCWRRTWRGGYMSGSFTLASHTHTASPRPHARTKRNDFPVGLTPPTSDLTQT